MTVKAVVFDLDGTVASFNLDYMIVRSDVRGLLMKKGLPASVLSSNESIFEMLKKTEIFLKNNGKSERAIQKVRNEALAIAEKYELEAAKTTGLLPGVVETLKALKKMSLKDTFHLLLRIQNFHKPDCRPHLPNQKLELLQQY